MTRTTRSVIVVNNEKRAVQAQKLFDYFKYKPYKLTVHETGIKRYANLKEKATTVA